VARHEYAFTVAQRIGVDVEVVQRALSEAPSGWSDRGGLTSSGDKRLPGNVKVEREALRLLLIHGAHVLDSVSDLDETIFTSPIRKELFNQSLTAARDGLPISRVATSLASDDALSLFTELTVGASVEVPAEKEIREIFMRLRVFRLEREIKKRRTTLQEVNPLDDALRHDTLFTELVGLEAERRDLLRSIQGAG
jgi:hypothetical protein